VGLMHFLTNSSWFGFFMKKNETINDNMMNIRMIYLPI